MLGEEQRGRLVQDQRLLDPDGNERIERCVQGRGDLGSKPPPEALVWFE